MDCEQKIMHCHFQPLPPEAPSRSRGSKGTPMGVQSSYVGGDWSLNYYVEPRGSVGSTGPDTLGLVFEGVSSHLNSNDNRGQSRLAVKTARGVCKAG